MADDIVYSASLDDDDVLKALDRIDKRIDKVADDGQKSFKQLEQGASKSGKTMGAIFNSATVKLTAAIGTVTALAATVKELTDDAIALEKANFNLAVSANAAAREFGTSVGTAESWRETLADIRQETKIYSEEELANATSRLIDMTKRLGLTDEQMQEVLKRTADLSAGKVDLAGGIERTTAALRGEAESAEFLGLALSETNVKSYAEAQGLVFKELSDTEKAQLRYQLLLEQTNEIQGRAAKFADTLAGKEAALNAQLDDQAALLGEQLLPLREGYAELLTLLSGETDNTASIVSKALAGIAAYFVTLGATATNTALNTIEALKAIGSGATSVKDALLKGENPFDALTESGNRFLDAVNNIGGGVNNLGKTYNDAFNQILDGWQQQREAARQTSDELANTPFQIGGEAPALVDTEELEKALDKQTELETDYFRNRIDIIRKNNQKASDIEEDFIQKRLDATREFLRDIEDIERKNAQAIEDSGTNLRRDEADALTDFNRSRADLERDSAKERIKIEEDYRDEIRKINQNFEDSADEAARNRDAVTFLRLQRERDRQIEEARTTRTKRVDEARTEVQQRREELNRSLQEQLEDARLADQRRLEDLQIRLDREYEEARINRERDLQDTAIAEDRKREEIARSLEQQLQEAQIANNRRVSDFRNSLDEEVKAQLDAEQKKTEIVRQQAAQRSSIYQQQINEAMQSRSPASSNVNPVFRQHGGPVGAGQTVGVAEGGRYELFRPQIAGNVIPLGPGITSPLQATNIASTVNNIYQTSMSQSFGGNQDAMTRAIAENAAADFIRRVIGG